MSDTDNESEDIQKEVKPKGNNSFAVAAIVVLIFISAAGFFYYKNIFPKHLMTSGKKYLQIKQYDKALRIFKYMQKKYPKDEEPVYYEVLALAKMPPMYENQKRLFEIAQFDDCDEAGKLAYNVLKNIRKQIELQAGINYIDNIFVDDTVIRWSNSHPITYAITSDSDISSEFLSVTDKAFKQWQRAINNELTFKQTTGNANIIIRIVDSLPEDKTYTTKDASAVTSASVIDNKLIRMDIYIKINDKNGKIYSENKLYGLLLHQIGHALGIGGHSISEYDVMYYDGDLIDNKMKPKDISLRDINTVNFLYQMAPDSIDENLPIRVRNNLLYHKIITVYSGENFEDETKRLLAELKDNDKNLVKWVDLANNYAINQQYARANFILENLLPYIGENKQKKFSIYYNMALNYYKIKDYELSLKYLNQAEEIIKNDKTKTLSAFLDIKNGKTDDAKTKLLELREKTPDNTAISVKLAEIYYKENKRKESRQIIKDLIKINPSAINDKKVLKYKK